MAGKLFNYGSKLSSVINQATEVVRSGTDDKEIPFILPNLHKRLQDNDRTHSEANIDVPNLSSKGSTGSLSHVGTFHGGCTSSLGSLNPELYKSPEEGDLLEYPEGHMGRLWFTVDFDKDTEKLNVSVGKVRNLPTRDLQCTNACDPFVRVFLLPDERRYVQTKIRRKTTNPNFGESFVFEVSKDTFEERTLKIVVFDVDTLKRNIPVGFVQYPLKEYARCKQKSFTTWRDLKMDDSEVACQLGEICISLCYNESLERITVVVIEAKDLKPPDDSAAIDTYCKVVYSLATKQVKVRKSHVVKKSLCPVFNESFAFKLSKDKLEQASFCVQVMEVKPETQIGRVTLAGQVFARGEPLDHWNEMVSKKKDTIQDWHYLTE